MTRLLLVEVRRDLARRLVWFLVGLGLVGSLVVGLLVAANSKPPDPRSESPAQRPGLVCTDAPTPGQTVCRYEASPPPSDAFPLVELWSPHGDGEMIIVVPIVFLAIGGLLAGASMVGAEWRAGTMATLLTWEPRRGRVGVAKLVAAVVLAFAISVALLVWFSAVLALVASVRGTTEGADAAWLRSLAGAVLRGGILVGIAAGAGASIAMMGRNTAAALGTAFAYLVIAENIVRAWKPWSARWLFGENATIFLTWRTLENVVFTRPPTTAALTLVAYVAALAVVAVALLRGRDVAST